jgi:hypothetical protein
MNSDLEKYYKKFNFPAASTFWIKLKGEDIKVTKKEVDEFISSRVVNSINIYYVLLMFILVMYGAIK